MEMKKEIVVLGAGFGGIKAAFILHKCLKRLSLLDKYEIVLVDKNTYHTYTPTLYEAATTSKDIANQIKLKNIVTFPLKTAFQGREVVLLNKKIKELDLVGGDIHFGDGGKLKFDYLVIALGSETNYFDIAGLEENSLTLKTFMDAIKIRDAIWDKVDAGAKKIKIVIGGGGSTGVELAGEIQSWTCQLDKELKNCKTAVKIIEGQPTILPGFDEKVIKKVTKRLKKIGVEILLGEFIEKVEPNKIYLKSKQLENFDILIWTGGVKASRLTGALPLRKDEKGKQIAVKEKMECLPQTDDLKLYGKIYGIGDAVCCYYAETGKPVPKIAEVAIQQAKIAAHNIIEDIKLSEKIISVPKYKKYRPKISEFPYIIPIGGKYAIAKFGSVVISGFLGWVLKGLVELYYVLLNVFPPYQAIKIWLKGLLIFIKNDRLG